VSLLATVGITLLAVVRSPVSSLVAWSVVGLSLLLAAAAAVGSRRSFASA